MRWFLQDGDEGHLQALTELLRLTTSGWHQALGISPEH